MVTECRQDAPSELEKRCLTRCGAMHGGFSMVPQMEALWKSPLKWKKNWGSPWKLETFEYDCFRKTTNEIQWTFEVFLFFTCSHVVYSIRINFWDDFWCQWETELRDFEGFVVPPQRLSPVETWRKRPSSWWHWQAVFPFFSPVHQSMKGRVSSLHRGYFMIL